MKKIILLQAMIILFTINAFAQDRTRMNPSDRLIIGLFTDIWSGLPDDMSTSVFNRGIAIDYIQEYPISTTNFSLAAGLGFAGHNMYSNHRYLRHNNTHEFQPIGDVDYRNNKLSLNYLNIPLEIRYRTRDLPRTLRLHAGIKAGVLVNAHTKYVGHDPGDTSRTTRIKEGRLDNIETFLIGFQARVGYGRFNLHAFAPITTVFKGNESADASFLSLGVSFILF
jgi:hypothetical protein